MTEKKKIYALTVNGGEKRLIRAPSKAAAVRYAYEIVDARLATPEECVELTLAGTKVEDV